MTLEKDFAGRQIVGARTRQEDYYAFCRLEVALDGIDGLLLVLADGMGAYAGGAVASRLVTESFVNAFCAGRGSVAEKLSGSLRQSHRTLVAEISGGDVSLAGMGSTLVVVVWTREWMQWLSVGDSPLFLFRGGKLIRLNADHSMKPVLAGLVAGGQISDTEADIHPERNTLRSAVVNEGIEILDLCETPFELKPEDIVVAVSDGVLNALNVDSIKNLLASTCQEPASGIVNSVLSAVEKGGCISQDNATVALIKNCQLQFYKK